MAKQFVHEMSYEDLLTYAYDLQARLKYLAEHRNQQPLEKARVREFMLRDIITEDSAFGAHYTAIAAQFDSRLPKLIVDIEADRQEAVKEFITLFYRRGNPDSPVEGLKRCGTLTRNMASAYNQYCTREDLQLSQNQFTSIIKILGQGYKIDKGVDPNDPRVATGRCLLGWFPNERFYATFALLVD